MKKAKVGGLQSVLIWTPALQLLELPGVMSPLYFLLSGKQPLLGTVPLDAIRAQELLATRAGKLCCAAQADRPFDSHSVRDVASLNRNP